MTNYLALAAAALREAHAECIKWRLAEAEAMAVLIGTEERCEKLTAEIKRLHNDGRETTIMLGEAVAEVERLKALLREARTYVHTVHMDDNGTATFLLNRIDAVLQEEQR